MIYTLVGIRCFPVELYQWNMCSFTFRWWIYGLRNGFFHFSWRFIFLNFYLDFSIPLLLIWSFLSLSYLFWLLNPVSIWTFILGCKATETSFQQFCMHSLSKKCTSNFTNRDANLFGTSFECTPYQKKCASNISKYRQWFIFDQFCMHSLSKNSPQI